MRYLTVIATSLILLALPGCNKGLSGSYRCTGMSDITSLTLDSDGRYTSRGNILGHATTGSGTYKGDPGHVTLRGSYKVDGLTQAQPNFVIFDREKKGVLRAMLTTCMK